MVKGPFNVHIKSDYTDITVDLPITSQVGALFGEDDKLLEVSLRREAPERPLGFLIITFTRVVE